MAEGEDRTPCYAGKLLDAWLESSGQTQEWMIDEINRRLEARGLVGAIARSNVWRWRMGRQKPTVDNADVVAEITGGEVPTSAWATGAEGRASDSPEAA